MRELANSADCNSIMLAGTENGKHGDHSPATHPLFRELGIVSYISWSRGTLNQERRFDVVANRPSVERAESLITENICRET